jgi:hypothetical protein
VIPSFDEYQELALRTASAESLVDQSTMLNAAALGLNGEAGEIASMNVEKLRKRYPDGFSTERSLNRPHG